MHKGGSRILEKDRHEPMTISPPPLNPPLLDAIDILREFRDGLIADSLEIKCITTRVKITGYEDVANVFPFRLPSLLKVHVDIHVGYDLLCKKSMYVYLVARGTSEILKQNF